MSSTRPPVEPFLAGMRRRNPSQPEFQQAVEEVARDIIPVIESRPELKEARILERLTEPDRIVSFRVCWVDDKNSVRVNRAWRVQFNNAIGPYKGGLRFHPTVTESVLKFLGFEQIFKNALTGLPMGGAKGGSNFNPKGKSPGEVMRFCQSMMTELHRYIGEDTDIPAGDIGVGAREIGWLYGQYKRLAYKSTGAITGKGLEYGGSLVRKQATGYGAVYFMQNMLGTVNRSLEGLTAAVSGSGNVALYCIEKLAQLGAIPVTASDSDGFIHDPEGITGERLAFLIDLKENRRGRIREYAEKFGCRFSPGPPWGVPVQLAFPCATQNELNGGHAKTLLKNGLLALAEGANMPSDIPAQEILRSQALYAPGKASNAGGVAVSGLEQSQNSLRISWPFEEVDSRLKDIMKSIHNQCVQHGKQEDGSVDYMRGANTAAFLKVSSAMLAMGPV